jgi:hypothetical protein
MKTIAIKYFEAFERKDISAIREILDINVTLIDWEISVIGIDSVLAAVDKIFYSTETITIQIINIIQDQAFVCCEFNIIFNSLNSIHVVDIIEFNSIGKICAIRAFKG